MVKLERSSAKVASHVDFTLAIMAGGKSSRMGTNKAFVEVGGQPIIERIIERTANIGQAETILIANQPSEYAHLGLPIVTDVMLNKGSLGGIYTAITHSEHEYTLTIACDMPFVSAPLIAYMLGLVENTNHYDAIVPRVESYPQGLHSLYRNTCLDPIRKRLEANHLKVMRLYDDIVVRYLDEADYAEYDTDKLAFMNVNTPADLQKARHHAQNIVT